MATRRLRRLYQTRFGDGLLGNNRSRRSWSGYGSRSSDGRHLRLHHCLTVTLGTEAHGGLAAEEAAHVLAHHGTLGRLRGRLLGDTLGGHLCNETHSQVTQHPQGAQRLHQKLLQKQTHSQITQTSRPGVRIKRKPNTQKLSKERWPQIHAGSRPTQHSKPHQGAMELKYTKVHDQPKSKPKKQMGKNDHWGSGESLKPEREGHDD